MTKTYILNRKMNASTFTVYTEGGNGVCYQFKGGNVNTNTLPFFVTDNEYYQYVLEHSEMFKTGTVSYDANTAKKVAQNAAKEVEAANANNSAKTEQEQIVVSSIKSVTQAVNYVSENFGVVVRTAEQAKNEAAKHGVVFPNLKTGK